MTDTDIPSWPRIEAIARADGSGEVTINGTSYPVAGSDADDARQEILDIVADKARKLGQPVHVTATEDSGPTWRLFVHPDGRVEEPDADGAASATTTRRDAPAAAPAASPAGRRSFAGVDDTPHTPSPAPAGPDDSRPVEFGREEDRRGLQDRVGLLQLSVLPFQPLQLRGLLGRHPWPLAGVDLGLAAPLAHVSGVPTPSNSATRLIADHSDSWSVLTSATIRTARSRNSVGYLRDELPDMTPTLPRLGVSGLAGAVQPLRAMEPLTPFLRQSRVLPCERRVR